MECKYPVIIEVIGLIFYRILSTVASYLIACAVQWKYDGFDFRLAHRRYFDWDDVCEELNFSVLHRVIYGLHHEGLEEALKAYPKEINKRDRFGYSTLWHACSMGREDYARVLLSHGADPSGNDYNHMALVAAIGRESSPCVRALLEYHTTILLPLFRDPKMVDCIHLYLKCHGGNANSKIEIDKLLTDHGLSFDFQDQDGCTALMRCCGPFWSYSLLSPFRLKRMTLFLDSGVNTELKDLEGKTALYYAIMSSNTCAFNVLVLAGARLDPRMTDGSTVLHLAVRYANEISIVQALVEADTAGIEVEARDGHGYSAFDLMKQRARRHLTIRKSFLYPPFCTTTTIRDHRDWRHRYFASADTPEEEVEIVAVFGALFRKLQDERNVPADARYPALESPLESLEPEGGESDTVQDEMAAMPGAWLE